MTARRTKATRGGKREGAGRPREVKDPVRLTVDFERPDFEALERFAAAREESLAAALRRIVHGFFRRSGRL